MADVSGTGFDAIVSKLQRLVETARTTGLRAAGLSLLTSAQKKITDGGNGWPPWSTAYQKRIDRHGPAHQMLWLNGTLLRSLTFGGADNIFDQTDNAIRLGSNVSYAARQQWGENGIPSRPFLTLDSDSMTLAEKAYFAQIKRVLES